MNRATGELVLLLKEFSDAERMGAGSIVVGGLHVGFRRGRNAAVQRG